MTGSEPVTAGAYGGGCGYDENMKRKHLLLDEKLLDEAVRVLRVKTYSAAVNAVLVEVLRVRKIQSLPDFFGRIDWQGDLSEMREDRPRRRRK